MLASDIAKRLLVFTDNRTLSEAATAGTEYLESAVDAINAAAQQIYLLGPSTISIRDFGMLTRPQATITATGNQYEATATLAGSESWMVGCSCQIGSAIPYNRILSITAGVATMQNPLDVAQAESSMTVWGDALAISADITEVLYGVTLDDKITLRAASSEPDLYSDSLLYNPGDYGRAFPNRLASRPPVPGQPRAYYMAPIMPTGNAASSPLYLRLSPYPVKTHTLRFRARVRPPKVTVLDLDAPSNGANCTKQIPIPAGWDESFLLPVAKQIFTGSPFFNNSAQKDEIARAYKGAIETLDQMRGQASRPLSFVPAL